MKLKSFCTAKGMSTRSKRQPTEWEKIIASYICDKRLINIMYREFKKLNSQRINDPMKKWANELNGAFSEKEVQTAKTHTKKCSTSLAIRPIQSHIKILPHPCYNDYHEEQILLRIQ
jgi:hypothetical protein